MAKDLSYYQSQRYTRQCQLFVEEGTRYWLAWIEELAGCKVEGSSKEEAYKNLGELFDDYITSKLQRGTKMPEPKRPKKRTTCPAKKLKPEPRLVSLRLIEPSEPLNAGIDGEKSEDPVTAGV